MHMNTISPTPYPAVNEILRLLLACVQEILRVRVAGFRLDRRPVQVALDCLQRVAALEHGEPRVRRRTGLEPARAARLEAAARRQRAERRHRALDRPQALAGRAPEP